LVSTPSDLHARQIVARSEQYHILNVLTLLKL
jgi:hypothetical protein